jgi:hypothetical protein
MNPDQYNELILTVPENRHLKIENGRLCRRDFGIWKSVIKRPDQEEIIRELHEGKLAAHRGINAVTNKIKERYWWPKVREDVQAFIRSCIKCQKDKKPKPATDIYPYFLERPMQIVGIDHVGPLDETPEGFKHIIVMQDYFTKYPFAAPVKSTDTDEVLEFLLKELGYFGMPEQIVSDRGTAFTSHHWKNCMKAWGIKHTPTNAMNPQSNGLVERYNKTLQEGLRKKVDTRKDQWHKHIPALLMDYRTAIHATTGYTPIFLMCGFQARLPIEAKYPVPVEEYLDALEARKAALRELHPTRIKVAAKIRKKQEKLKAKYESNKEPATPFKEKDLVLLYKPAGKRKLDQPMEGPFRIHKVLPNRTYILETMGNVIRRETVTGRRLKLYIDRSEARIEIGETSHPQI